MNLARLSLALQFSSQEKSSQVKSSQVKSSQVKSNKVKSGQVKSRMDEDGGVMPVTHQPAFFAKNGLSPTAQSGKTSSTCVVLKNRINCINA